MKFNNKKIILSSFVAIFILVVFTIHPILHATIKYKLSTISNSAEETKVFCWLNEELVFFTIAYSFVDKDDNIIKMNKCEWWNDVKYIIIKIKGQKEIFYEVKNRNNIDMLLRE